MSTSRFIGLWWVQIAGASNKVWHLQSTESRGLTFCGHLNKNPLDIGMVSLKPFGDACNTCIGVYQRDVYYRVERGYDLTPCMIGAHTIAAKIGKGQRP
jgi:hypothetical protein